MDQSGVYGYPDMVALQHFHDFLQQIKQFSVERIERQLECFDERFRTLKQEFIEVYTTSCSSKSPVQTAKPQQPPKKLDILSQKYRTPMGKTVYSVLGGANVNKVLDDMNESLSSAPTSANDVTYNVKLKDELINPKTAPKKRNAKAADISIVNEDSADERDQDKENNNNYKETTKVKKSSKKVVDEENNDDGTETEEATSTKKKSAKANAKSGKKKKKLKTGSKKGKKTKDDNEEENNDDQPDQKASEQEKEEQEEDKNKRRPSKKFKSSEEGEENTNKEPQATEKKEKKKKLTKQKTITDSTDQADKTLTGQRLSKHMLKSTMKTPSNIKRISLKILQSTIKKSTKPKRPLTRRAAAAEKAAAAAAKSSVVSSSSSSTTTSTATSSSNTAITKMTAADVVASISGETTKASNIPQLIRPPLEAIRTNTKDPGRIPATPQSTLKSTNNNFKFVKNTISKINKTFRSSIDKHKARLSQSKPDAKKKSEKQVKAFLNVVGDKTTTENLVKTKPGSKEMSKLIETGTISSSSSSTTTTTTTTTTTSLTSSKKDSNENRNGHDDDDDMIDATVIITDDESEHTEPKTPDSSSVNNKSELKSTYHLHKDRELIEKSFKSRSPKLFVSKIPEHLLQPNVSAAHADKIMNENDKRLTREPNQLQQQSILGTVQQPSRMLPMKAVSSSAIKATPSRPNYLQTGIPRPIISSSTSNLMTPSKLTWTEMEEKRKAELALKEAKDKERLADLEKQRQEKRDELKKKREEKVKKVNDLKARQKEEQEAKAKEMEKKRLEEAEKKKQADETTKLDADRSKLVVAKKPLAQPTNNIPSSVFGSAQKKPNIVLNPISLNKMSELTKAKNLNEEFKKSLVNIPKPIIPTVTYEPSKTNAKNFEQTYILDQSPKGKSNHHNTQSYEVTPLQPPKLKDQENYDVSDLKSGDDTDDDEAPSKPIPDWAREPYLNKKAQIQSSQMVNFTKLFKSASKAEINLEQIFRIKRKKFIERSSSANWTTPPIWSGNGINGEESFLQLRNIAND